MLREVADNKTHFLSELLFAFAEKQRKFIVIFQLHSIYFCTGGRTFEAKYKIYLQYLYRAIYEETYHWYR